MFAKKFKLGKEFILSSKDKKKLQSKQNANTMSKQTQIKQASITGTKIKIYLEESETWIPVFIESDVFFPSIFLLWKIPDYLPVVYTWPAVSKFIINGADLMWPGVANPESITGILKVDSIVAVSVVGNVPIAVGIITSDAPVNNNKGKCVRILHYYRDELWMMYQSIPNEGFLIHKVVPIVRPEIKEEIKVVEMCEEENLSVKVEDQSVEERVAVKIEEIVSEPELVLKEVKLLEGSAENKEIDYLVKVEEKSDIEEKIGEIKDGNIEENVKNKEINQENCEILKEILIINEECKGNIEESKEINEETKEFNQNKESVEEYDESCPNLTPDEIVMEIFLTALTIAVNPEDFPLEPSTLQRLMHGCKRSLTLDFSQSSYKKIGKFLDHAKKLLIIEFEKPKTSDHKLLLSYNKQHPLLVNFVPIVRKLKITPKETLETVSKYPKVIFTSCVIPKFEFNDFFSVVVPDRSHKAFQKSEANSLLNEYLRIKGLEISKTTVKTDLVLQKALKCGESVPKNEIFLKFKNLFEEGYVADYTSGLLSQMVYYGAVPIIDIKVIKGRGKYKKVTVVKEFESYLIDADELQELTQKTFSASTTIKKEETKSKSSCYLQVFGNHSEKFPTLLNEYFKIPKSQIKVTIL